MKHGLIVFFWGLSNLLFAFEHKPLKINEMLSSDYSSFYSVKTSLYFLPTLTLAGLLANTPADQAFGDFYQKELRSKGTNIFSSIVKPFGNRSTALGLFASYLLLKALASYTEGTFFLRYTEAASRLLLVGTPPLLLLQVILGATRPSALSPHSRWKPFQNTRAVSASGHAFFGAVPFLAGAFLFESPMIKSLFIVASMLTGVSRLNDNKHYMSQVILGWSMAYFSYRALVTSESKLRFSVLASNQQIGLGLSYRFE